MNPNRNVRNLRCHESGDSGVAKMVNIDHFGVYIDETWWYLQFSRGFLGEVEIMDFVKIICFYLFTDFLCY